jgi:hypothetical protein
MMLGCIANHSMITSGMDVPGLAKVSRFGCISSIEPVEVVQGGKSNMLALQQHLFPEAACTPASH